MNTRVEQKNSTTESSQASSDKKPMIKDELGAVRMIKIMSKEQKAVLNDMVHSVLVHQQNCDSNEILITTTKRSLNQAKQRFMQAELEKAKTALELKKIQKMKQDTISKFQEKYKHLVGHNNLAAGEAKSQKNRKEKDHPQGEVANAKSRTIIERTLRRRNNNQEPQNGQQLAKQHLSGNDQDGPRNYHQSSDHGRSLERSQTQRVRKRTLSVRRYKVSRDGSMQLLSRQDSVRDCKDLDEAEPLTNFAQINPILKEQKVKQVETARLRTQRRLTRREKHDHSQTEEKKALDVDEENEKSSSRLTYRAYYRIEQQDALTVRNHPTSQQQTNRLHHQHQDRERQKVTKHESNKSVHRRLDYSDCTMNQSRQEKRVTDDCDLEYSASERSAGQSLHFTRQQSSSATANRGLLSPGEFSKHTSIQEEAGLVFNDQKISLAKFNKQDSPFKSTGRQQNAQFQPSSRSSGRRILQTEYH